MSEQQANEQKGSFIASQYITLQDALQISEEQMSSTARNLERIYAKGPLNGVEGFRIRQLAAYASDRFDIAAERAPKLYNAMHEGLQSILNQGSRPGEYNYVVLWGLAAAYSDPDVIDSLSEAEKSGAFSLGVPIGFREHYWRSPSPNPTATEILEMAKGYPDLRDKPKLVARLQEIRRALSLRDDGARYLEMAAAMVVGASKYRRAPDQLPWSQPKPTPHFPGEDLTSHPARRVGSETRVLWETDEFEFIDRVVDGAMARETYMEISNRDFVSIWRAEIFQELDEPLINHLAAYAGEPLIHAERSNDRFARGILEGMKKVASSYEGKQSQQLALAALMLGNAIAFQMPEVKRKLKLNYLTARQVQELIEGYSEEEDLLAVMGEYPQVELLIAYAAEKFKLSPEIVKKGAALVIKTSVDKPKSTTATTSPF